MLHLKNLFIVLLVLSLSFDIGEANFQIKLIRKAIALARRYGPVTMGEGLSGNTVARVLQNIDQTLSYLGLDYWVTMEEFANAAVRVGLSREVGIKIWHIVSWIV